MRMRAFQQMIEDCTQRKIGLILVKSISCMGRNTVQFVQTYTELKRLGVDVYYEVEQLSIHDPKSVLMLTIYAGLYQNESESISFSVGWGIRTRFAN